MFIIQLRTRHCAIPREDVIIVYVTDYTSPDYTHQQVIGLGHQIQAFIQMPLIFMTGDVIWAARWPRTVRPPSSWCMDTVKFYGLFPNHAPPHGGFTLSCLYYTRGPTRYRYTAGRYDLSRNRYKNSDTENRYTKTLTISTIHQHNDSLFEVISYENTKTN